MFRNARYESDTLLQREFADETACSLIPPPAVAIYAQRRSRNLALNYGILNHSDPASS